MKKMSEIKKLKDKDLIALVNEKREAIRGFRFGNGGGNPAVLRTAKTEIARALTELQARSNKPANATETN